jgi:hypothetical protein
VGLLVLWLTIRVIIDSQNTAQHEVSLNVIPEKGVNKSEALRTR